MIKKTLMHGHALLMCVVAAIVFHSRLQGAPGAGVPAGVFFADEGGAAIGGFDPVAYFAEGKAHKGDSSLKSPYAGATFCFARQESLDLFLKEPAKYLPAFGGWAAEDAILGKQTPPSPKNFLIAGGRLFLFGPKAKPQEVMARYRDRMEALAKEWQKRALAKTPASADARKSTGRLVVSVVGLPNDKGLVRGAVFTGPKGWPDEWGKDGAAMAESPVSGGKAELVFQNVPKGPCAVNLYHDANKNDKMDSNWLGIPTEGYGFSTDAKAVMSAPSFSSAQFTFEDETKPIAIRIQRAGL